MFQSKSFSERVSTFVSSLNLDNQHSEKLTLEIIRFVLQIQRGAHSSDLRRLTFRLDCFDDFNYFKTQYLDVSAYIHRKLWVAVVNKIKNNHIPKDDMLKNDVDFCLSYINNEEDINRVKQIEIKEELNVDDLDLATMKTGKTNKRDFPTYVKSKSYTLSYITDYDPGMTKEDLEQDLLCEAVRVFNAYPRSKCKNIERAREVPKDVRVQRYEETALNNKVMNIKEYHSCESRRRVATTSSALYKEKQKKKKLLNKDPEAAEFLVPIKKLERQMKDLRNDIEDLTFKRKKLNRIVKKANDRGKTQQEIDNYTDQIKKLKKQRENLRAECKVLQDKLDKTDAAKALKEIDNKIKNTNSDYYSVVSPLVRQEDGELRVIDVPSDNSNIFMYQAEVGLDSRLWIEGICSKLDPNLAKFVRIVTGEHVPDFETWANKKNINTDLQDSLEKGARKYCSISKSDLVNNTVLLEALGRT